MRINVLLNEINGGLYEIYSVQRYEIDTKTGFLKINYEAGKVYFFKLRDIVYFRIFN